MTDRLNELKAEDDHKFKHHCFWLMFIKLLQQNFGNLPVNEKQLKFSETMTVIVLKKSQRPAKI